MIPEQGKQDKPVTFYTEQHEPEMTQEEKDAQEWMNASLGKPEKYVYYVIQVEPNNTIGLYKDGKYVKSIDFWILDGRGNQ